MDSDSGSGIIRRSTGDTLQVLRDAIELGKSSLIVDGKLLPERELTQVMGVSRRKIREALDTLETEGVIFRRQGQGTFTRPSSSRGRSVETIASRTSPVEIMEVRREIEPQLAKLAAFRASPADLDAMRRLAQRTVEATNADDLDRWDRALHAKIASCAANGFFYRIFEMIDAVRAESSWIHYREASFHNSNREFLDRQHYEIVIALESRDPKRAEAAMRTHLETITEMVMRHSAPRPYGERER